MRLKWAEEAARPREFYINSPAPTHTSLATLFNFLLTANN